MSFKLPSNTPEILRAAGLKVDVVPGWETRGRPSSTGSFNPVGVGCHHTATGAKTPNASVKTLLIQGRADLPGPLSNFGLQRDGTVVLVAAGRCNHGGTAKASGTVAAGDANELYMSIEAYNDGVGEPWNSIQYNAYVLLCAVLSVEFTKNSVQTVRGHKEWSVTGKIDPTFDMSIFRDRVEDQMELLQGKGKPETVLTRGPGIDSAIESLTKVNKHSGDPEKKKAAASALKILKAVKQNKAIKKS